MLNKELLMGTSKQEQLKVEMTLAFIDAEGGDYVFSHSLWMEWEKFVTLQKYTHIQICTTHSLNSTTS